MRARARRLANASILVVVLLATCVVAARADEKTAGAPSAPVDAARDDGELARIFDEDQADRDPARMLARAKQGVFQPLGPRDRARRARVRALLDAGRVRTPNDFFRAGVVFQHGDEASDYALAHELAMVALAKGHPQGAWLAAASWDRFLLIGLERPQRIGTNTTRDADGRWTLEPIDADVPDVVRTALGRKPLDERRRDVARMNEDEARAVVDAGAR